MVDLKSLQNFLNAAGQAGYTSGNESAWIKEDDGSTTITYKAGGWSYHDNFFEGEPYGGREVVFFKGKAVWMAVYYGWVEADVDASEVYAFLRQALKSGPENMPVRGPKELIQNKFKYINNWKGNLEKFSGEEKIFKDGRKIYQAEYNGGLVDQRGE